MLSRLRGYLLVAGFVAVALLSLTPSSAGAQGEELLSDEFCRADPYSEECICRNVRVQSKYPKHTLFDAGVLKAVQPHDAAIGPPVFDPTLNQWEGGSPEDYTYDDTGKYKAMCSLAYYQENQKRLTFAIIAIGVGLTTISITWAGFVHMQESASGESRSQARTILIRSLMGMILLALVFLAWEGFSRYFFGEVGVWDTVPGFLEDF